MIAEDGSLPAQAGIRCVAHEQGILWRWEGKDASRCCYMPTHLYMAHIYVIGQHSLTIFARNLADAVGIC